MDATTLRDYATDAIRWWEPKRIVYNAGLIAVVGACFLVRLPVSKQTLSPDTLLFLFALAVLANVAYCAAYVVDVFVQMSGFREQWGLSLDVIFYWHVICGHFSEILGLRHVLPRIALSTL